MDNTSRTFHFERRLSVGDFGGAHCTCQNMGAESGETGNVNTQFSTGQGCAKELGEWQMPVHP